MQQRWTSPACGVPMRRLWWRLRARLADPSAGEHGQQWCEVPLLRARTWHIPAPHSNEMYRGMLGYGHATTWPVQRRGCLNTGCACLLLPAVCVDRFNFCDALTCACSYAAGLPAPAYKRPLALPSIKRSLLVLLLSAPPLLPAPLLPAALPPGPSACLQEKLGIWRDVTPGLNASPHYTHSHPQHVVPGACAVFFHIMTVDCALRLLLFLLYLQLTIDISDCCCL
jgi:hypothetical protein